jgi:hypothetical protein
VNLAETIITTHAYMIRRKFIPVLLSVLLKREYKIDIMFSEALSLGKCFICSPVLVWQETGFSDIELQVTDNIHLK